jgi:hypothetical protein
MIFAPDAFLAIVAALLGDERLTAVVELYATIHRQPEH